MIKTLSTYGQYLKYPRLLRMSKNKATLRKDFLWLLVLNLMFALTIGLTYFVLLKFKLITKYEEFDLFKFGFPAALFLVVVLAPVCEEFLFRWQLTKPKLSIWFVAISAALLASSFTKDDYIRFFIIIFFLFIALLSTILIDKLKRLKAVYLFRTYYVFLFYYTAIIFGYVHISNIKGLTLSDPSFVLYISSQIFGGLTMGYIRVKYGLKYSMILHASFNAVLVPIAWFCR